MRKMTLSIGVAALIMCGVADASLRSLVKERMGADIEIISSKHLNTDGNLKIVVIKDKVSGYRALAITNRDESVLFGVNNLSVVKDRTDQESIDDELNLTLQLNNSVKSHKTVLELIDKVPQDYVINLGDSSKKTTFYIVSDPMCLHCQAELENIEKKLRIGSVKMIVIGLLGEQSARKAQEISDKVKGVKGDAKKIEIIRKIYKDSYVSKVKNIDGVRQVTLSLSGKGKVEAVPYIIEMNN